MTARGIVFAILIGVTNGNVGAPALAAQDHRATRETDGSLAWQPLSLSLRDSTVVEVETAWLRVPERRGTRRPRPVEVGLIRLPGRTASAVPILYLPGSPGGASGSESLREPEVHRMLDRLRDAGDVLVMDYRGSGRSRPRLTCSDSSAPPSLPPRALLAVRDTALAHFTREARACARRLRAAGTDLQGYTWSEVAHDVESLRRALGVPRLALVGFSSGTHAALAALRLHESLASRVVLIGTEGPDHTRKLPSQLDRQMARIDSMIRADSAMRTEIPDFTGLVRTVLRSLERQPAQVTVRLPGGPVDVAVGAFALQYITTRSLSGPEEFDLLPRLYLATSRGDLRPLTRIVERLMRPNPPDPLDFIFDAASGVSAARWKAIEREATTALLGPAANFPFPDIGPAWGVRDLGSEFRSPIRTRIPTLFVTGSFDANTPPSNVEEIRRGFAHHWSVIVENAGHTGAFGAPATADVVLAFLRGDAPASTRIQVGPPRLTLPSR